jgi:hypothetical protein
MLRGLIFFAVVFSVSSCSLSSNWEIHSGSIDNREVEENLPKKFSKYKPQLDFSNTIVDLMISNEYTILYSDFFADEFRQKLEYNDLISAIDNLLLTAGQIESYLPLQWHFIKEPNDGRPILRSIKIVEHQNLKIEYILVFDGDDPDKIIGISFRSLD